MSTTPVSPSQRLRIAIALAALKYKPPEQSIQTYTLDLRYYFCRSPPTKSTSEECDSWRKRALQLEAELHATRAATTTDDVGLLVTKPPLPSAEDYATEPTPPSASKKKGKRTKKPPKTSDTRGPQVPEMPPTATEKLRVRDAVPSGNNKPPGSSLWTNHRLFSSLHALDDIATKTATKSASPLDAAPLVTATIRCIDVLQVLLARAISPACVTLEDATPQEALEGIERILPHILRTVIPALHGAYIDSSNAARLQWHAEDEPSHPYETTPALDLILARLTTGVLVPAIRALVPCTLAKTEHILSALRSESPKRDFVDGAQLLSLISAVLDALPVSQYIALHDRVALEAVRELTSLIADRPSRVPRARPTPAQRIHRIARKDALHFLCDAVLLAFRRSAPARPGGPQETLLRAALSDALGDLSLTQSVRETESGRCGRLDVVEEHLVMVVFERAWSIGLRVGHIGGDVDDKMDASHDGAHQPNGDVDMMDVDREDRAKEDRPWAISEL